MEGSIRLSVLERNTLLRQVKSAPSHEQRLRCHIILLLGQQCAWTVIAQTLFTSSSTINRWRKRFLKGRLSVILEASGRCRPSRFGECWVALIFHWVTRQSPQDFGFYRSRWTCGTIVVLLHQDHDLRVGRETVRRWLHQKDLVYRRPRPVLGPKDPQRPRKILEIRALLRNLPADEMAVFQDEVDINTNPKIGSMWMLKGRQAQVITPGTNTKRYLAGSLDWRTGHMTTTEGPKRNGELFLKHLDDLRRRYRRYRVIHVICDNARFHKPELTRAVKKYMEQWGHRVRLHFLPCYAPDTNPIERVWWHLHEQITRNHRCTDMEQLLDQVLEWLGAQTPFQIETSAYDYAKAA